MSEKNILKPLGHSSYGSIPHLPGSRVGPKDHHCHEGQLKICTEKTRTKRDRIIVTEKLDGSNCSVARINGILYPLGRAGYIANTSKFEMHQLFYQWVMTQQDRFLSVLQDGQRLVGEWLAQAHGSIYNLPHEPFVAFDLMTEMNRVPYDAMLKSANAGGFTTARLLSDNGPFSIERMLEVIEPSGHGSVDPTEGAVWRVENDGKFDFIAKWVRPDKVDGKYLPEQSGKEAVWNWRP